MIPVVGNAAKGISEGVQNANNGLVGRVTEKSQQSSRERKKLKKQVQSKVAEVKQQLRQLWEPSMELAGVKVGRIEAMGTVGENTPSSSPKQSNSQPPPN